MFVWLSSCALMVDGLVHLPHRHHYTKSLSTAKKDSLAATAEQTGLRAYTSATVNYDFPATFNSSVNSSGYIAEFFIQLDTGSSPFGILGRSSVVAPLVINGTTCSSYDGDCNSARVSDG